MVLADPLEVTLVLVKVLERLGIPYLVGGSLASSLHGIPRATQDVDLVLDLRLDQVEALVAKLKDGFYIDADMIREAIRHGSCCNIIHLPTMLKLDLFIQGSDPLAREEMARRQPYTLPELGHTLYLASPEDVVLQKLLWFELGAGVSERQWKDALGVVKVQASSLDLGYLRRWATRCGIADLLGRLLGET